MTTNDFLKSGQHFAEDTESVAGKTDGFFGEIAAILIEVVGQPMSGRGCVNTQQSLPMDRIGKVSQQQSAPVQVFLLPWRQVGTECFVGPEQIGQGCGGCGGMDLPEQEQAQFEVN